MDKQIELIELNKCFGIVRRCIDRNETVSAGLAALEMIAAQFNIWRNRVATPTPPEGQVEAVAEWPDNIVADRHDTTGKWVLHYLTDEQAAKCRAALQASGAEHIARLVGALIECASITTDSMTKHALKVTVDRALQALPPEIRGK